MAASDSGQSPRVLTIAPMPPEKIAYALARYSRSPDSIRDSIDWVRSHDAAKFLESFYFQYGHASIADLGHLTICFEGVSELAATEIEDEQLWDGQARSSRYQDFSRSRVIVPPELSAAEQASYEACAERLIDTYSTVHAKARAALEEELPRPDDMKPDAYQRNLAARAFDVARYLLPFGIPTGVGQVTSIRTLEKQIRRLKASEFQELREIGEELAKACAEQPACTWGDGAGHPSEPLAPTLARHADPDEYAQRLHADLREWITGNQPFLLKQPVASVQLVDLLEPKDHVADLCATLLYPLSLQPYRVIFDLVRSWSAAQRQEVIDVAIGSRARRDELPRHFRSSPYVADITMDIGAYRDLHRHRRCQQYRQQYTSRLGYEVPTMVERSGASGEYAAALAEVDEVVTQLPQPAAQYLLPFAARSRFLFKMDFAELEYISRLRSGVKGHFSYRAVAWELKRALDRLDPQLGALVKATPPTVVEPLKR
jgi:thymidylate synthase ThyX